jgi:LuxR family maltose regulon positive regulatory protein
MAAVASKIDHSTGVVPRYDGAHCVLVDVSPIPFDIFESRIHVPDVRPDSVSRTALVNRLRARTSGRVVSVVAPAGYGKTTLLTQWAARDQRPFVWVTADSRDDDPVVLLRHLAAAFDLVSPLDREVLDALVSPGPSIWTAAVPRLAKAISEVSEPVVLVLDDAHLVRDRDAADAVYALAEHLPVGSVLATAARVPPPLPIASLRAAGRLLELRADDLALTRRETEALLRGAGLDLSSTQIDELACQTEGWAAALSLVIFSLTDAAQRKGTNASTPAHDGFVAEYMETEYFSSLTADELDFLRKTAVLDHVCASLCDAALGVSDSVSKLVTLARTNLFIVPLDGSQDWYRCHRMLRDLLRRHLAERDPEATPALHDRAADWFEAHGDQESALDHASDAGDLDRVARLTTALALPVYDNGRTTTVQRWLARFDDDEMLERYPAVAAHGARVHALCGRTEEAERWLAAAESGAERPGRPAAVVRPWIAALRATFCRDGVDQMLADAELALGALPDRSEWRPGTLLVRGAAHAFTGDHASADSDFADAAVASDRLGQTETHLLAYAERSLLAGALGDADAAEALALAPRDNQGGDRGTGFSTAAIHLAATARAHLRHGRWDAARAQLAKAQQLTPLLNDGLPWLAVQARLELARAYVTLRDVGAARALIAEIDEVLELRPALGSLVDDVDDLRAEIAAIPRVEPGRASGLTGAELRLLPLLATHLSFREMGSKLYVSRNTIKTQAISVYRKLGVCTRSEAVDRAGELGLIEVAPTVSEK